uniref:Uncharacterized protein n=1 Tax=Avena sativa TaxID=4498 RepID=A0ACD5U3J1_AVESA
MSRNLLAADSPAFIVLNHEASIGKIGNATTAYTTTNLGRTVGVSFRAANPPQPSEFVLHFPGLDDGAPDKNIVEIDKHRIIATHRDVALLQLSVCNPVIRRMDDFAHEHFVYFAASTGQRPSLYLIPEWPDCILDIGGGYSAIFSDGYKRFNIVALRPRLSYASQEHQYEVCLFSSETGTWTKQPMKLQPPTKEEELWKSEVRRHVPSKVITLEGGTVCWIDLSCGILFCNNLFPWTSNQEIRYVPLPKTMLRNKKSFSDTASSFRDISG